MTFIFSCLWFGLCRDRQKIVEIWFLLCTSVNKRSFESAKFKISLNNSTAFTFQFFACWNQKNNWTYGEMDLILLQKVARIQHANKYFENDSKKSDQEPNNHCIKPIYPNEANECSCSTCLHLGHGWTKNWLKITTKTQEMQMLIFCRRSFFSPHRPRFFTCGRSVCSNSSTTNWK